MRTSALILGGLAILSTLVLLAFQFPRFDEEPVTSPLPSGALFENTTSTAKNDDAAKKAAASAASMNTNVNPSVVSVEARQATSNLHQPGDLPAPSEDYHTLHNSVSQSAAGDEPLAYQLHIPLVFLDHSAVLPATEEAAAAVQKLQQNFIDSTGAATVNPADPNYAALWDQLQPSADEQFCAIFGTEACNALSIAEARQRGHF